MNTESLIAMEKRIRIISLRKGQNSLRGLGSERRQKVSGDILYIVSELCVLYIVSELCVYGDT